jgi:hypothetical protein
METFEDLGAVIGTVDVDTEALIGRAVVAGRRRQRRRWVGAGVGVLAVGSLAVATAMQLGGSSETAGVATEPTTASTDSPGNGLPSPDVIDARLVAQLPVPGDLVSATVDHGGGVHVERRLDPDGSGEGTLDLELGSGRALGPGEISDTASKCLKIARLTGPESCKKVDGGWVFSLIEQQPAENGPPRPLDWSATMVRIDGTTVAVHATNYGDRHLPTRPTPVLDADQLGHLAVDPVWFEPAS